MEILLPDINFNGNCLINNISIPKRVINLYIFYILPNRHMTSRGRPLKVA